MHLPRFLPLLIAGFMACASHPTHPESPRRAGPIWNVAEKRFMAESEFIQIASGADLLLLGERHDHPLHHVLQARVIQALTVVGKAPAVALEMLPADKQPQLDAYRTQFPGLVTGMEEAIGWNKSGWPKWNLYAPIFEIAVQQDLPLFAADIPTPLQKEIRTQGAAVFPVEWKTRYHLQEPLPTVLDQQLREEIVKSHCGYATSEMVDGLTTFQRIRDAYLADRMLSTGKQTILIAGNGHVRNDRGVPLYLRLAAPDRKVLTLSFLEEDGAEMQSKKRDELSYDYVWFTERLNTEDPCVTFRKSLEKMRKHP